MEEPCFRLVAGLGNPGREYERTRHNVGFLVADALVRRAGAAFTHESRWDADIARTGAITVMKPMTFMNLSGEAVGEFCRYFKLESAQVLVVVDDVALPTGRLRIRRSGSSGGHNGLESVMIHLGTEQVPRLRVGIGGHAGDMTGHVLGRFSPGEEEELRRAVEHAADAVYFANENGLDAAMNRFNPKEPNQ